MNMSLYDKFTSKENLKTAFFYLKEEIDHSTLPLDPISKPTLNAITELGDEFFDTLAKYLQNGHYKPGQADYTFAQKDNLSLLDFVVKDFSLLAFFKDVKWKDEEKYKLNSDIEIDEEWIEKTIDDLISNANREGGYNYRRNKVLQST